MELLKALQDRSLTSEERLKVACFIWHEGDVPIGSKESVLVKWVCEEISLAYSKKTRAPPPVTVCSKLWEFLSIMVQALQLHPQDSFQPSFSTFMIQSMNKIFVEAITCEDSDILHCAESVLKSLDCILSLAPLPPVLYKYELMAGLVHSVMKLTLSRLMSGRSSGELSAGLKQLLKHYVYLQGTQGNQKKVFITTCGQLLEPVLMLRKLLSPSNSSSLVPELGNEILNELDSITASLFSRDHLPEFTSAVAAAGVEEEKGGEKRSATSYTRVLFQSLEKFLEPSNPGLHQVVIDNLPALFEAFLSQNSKENLVRKTVEFQFLCKLLHLLGYELQKGTGLSLVDDGDAPGDFHFTPVEWCSLVRDLHVQRDASTDGAAVEEEKDLAAVEEEEGLAALVESDSVDTLNTVSKCLKLVLKYGTYQVAEDKISGGNQFTQLQLLSSLILRKCKMNTLDGVFSCLSILLKLNHRIIEPHLAGIWLLTFTLHQGSEKMEVGSFANDCISIYSKLRQLPLLIAMQLEGLKLLTSAPVLLPTFPALYPTVEILLAKHLRELPPGQCGDILESLCHHFQEKGLAKLQACCVGKAPKRKKRKKDGRMSIGATSTVTIGDGGCLVAAVQKFVDLFGIVLPHIPLETFTGRVGERATSLLQRIHSEVCLPFLEACPSLPSDLQPSMCCASLHLVSKWCQLQACLKAVFPDLLQSGLMLDQLFQVSSGKMIPQCWRDPSSMSMSQHCDYLLRELVILKLRFTIETSQETTFEDLVNFVFEIPTTALTDAPWTGQLLDINEANSCVANWSLVLSQLPLLYQLCSNTHLRQVAEFILQALLLAVREKEEELQEGTTCVGVAVSVLESEGFASMRRLQELLLDSIFVHAASSIPKWFPNELKGALFHCTEKEAEAFPQVCNAIFSNILHHGLGALGADVGSCHKRSRSISKWLNHLTAYLKLMRTLPLSAMHPSVLTKSLVVVTVWHISTAQLIMASHMTEVAADKVITIMADLQYLMAWILHSLTTHQRRRGSKKKKQSDVQMALPIELLLQWLYREQLHCKKTKGNNLLASSLVAMEMAFGLKLWQGEFNLEFTKTVVDELKQVIESCSSSFYMEECLKAITHLTCKVYQELGPGHKYSDGLQVALEQLLEMFTGLLEHISQSEPSGGPSCHPAVVSAFITIIYCRTDLISPRCLKMVTLLCTSTSLPCLLAPKDRLTFCQQLEKLFGMLDVLSLPAAIAQSSAVKDATEVELPSELHVLTSWRRLQEVLGYIFDQSGCTDYSAILAPMKGPKSHYVVSSETVNIGSQDNLQEGLKMQVCTKIFHVMSQLLAAASREETASVFEQTIQLDSSLVVSVCVFCCCWYVVLDSKLSQESRRELRKWLTRVLLKCEVIASLHQSSATHAVTMATQLATRLVALPQQVGLDRRSVVVSLHLCSSLETSTDLRMRMQQVKSVAQLVTAVIRNHSAVAISCAGPVISTLNKLLHIVVEAGQMVEEETSAGCDLTLVIHCASLVTRVMETLSSHKAFTKFVPYPIGEFIKTAQKGPVHAGVKEALLPGLFSLLKLCTDHDLAFVNASLDLAARESLQTLSSEYQKFYKFSGRV